jgi:trimeric autotransporter adhesin
MNRKLQAAVFVFVAAFAGLAAAAPPSTINYQGSLNGAGGAPVNGAVVMTFRLYNAASGGTALYTETQLSVGVSNGAFNAVIGSVTPLGLPFDQPYWLSVAINADAEMSPRQPLAASPYAFRARALDSAATIDGAQVTGAVNNASSAVFANVAGGLMASLPASQVSGALTSATIPAAQVTGSFAATQQLPTVPCASNQVPQWDGMAWACGTITAGNNGDITGNLTMVDSTPSAGNILKAGVPFMHNFGPNNTFTGKGSGNFSVTGDRNTATGRNALANVSTGYGNTGNGDKALAALTSGFNNTATGSDALGINQNGQFNSAFGQYSLASNTSGSFNTAIGAGSLLGATGSVNIALGANAGSNIGLGNNNILIADFGLAGDDSTIRIGRSGVHAKTHIAGIRGVTPGLPDALPVVIDSNGQLGTGASAGGGVTSVATGAGLTGGPITGTGTIGLASTQLLPTVSCAANQIAKWNGSAWACAADNDTNSGGTVTSITAGAGLTGGTITTSGTLAVDPASSVLTGNFARLGGNAAGTTLVLGATTNQEVQIIANNRPIIRFGDTGDGPNIALGNPANVAGGAGVQAATVGGGGVNAFPNSATATYSTVAGGVNNMAQGQASAVGGGNNNTASSIYATVAGGLQNTASGSSGTIGGGQGNSVDVLGGAPIAGSHSTISGGSGNRIDRGLTYATISGGSGNQMLNSGVSPSGTTIGGGVGNNAWRSYSTVGGGQANSATGTGSTVPGGVSNAAAGFYSFAAGQQAKANADGCFTWADNNATDFACNTANAFMVRATGGVQFRTNVSLSNGCNLAPGGGGWACTSSRETKKDFTATDVVDVLKRVAQMPVTQWRYISETSGARHIGPMAEDFYAAFGLGEDNKAINTVDISGVALAAIQGLNQLVNKKDAEIQSQSARIKLLEDALAAIQARLGIK